MNNKIKIYNTLTRKKEIFTPIVDNKVGIYYCGPTVYWTQHIGNLRGGFCADIVHRTFKYLGYDVNFVRNYTDVGHLTSDEDVGEDKMEKASKREALKPLEIAAKYIAKYEHDTSLLNIIEPTHKPRATECIDDIVEMIQVLLDKGYAYTTPLAVYFDVSRFEKYNELNKQELEQNISGAGSGEVSDSDKKSPYDFALWFFRAGSHKKALQYWESPFESSLVEKGQGFPGWHIECSAMSKKLIGSTLDIHMGGIEHISVHHTNEIAQSESASGVKFVNYWMHNEHLLVDGGKMSKSEGTSYTMDDIVERGFSASDLRFFFLQAHYKSKQNFTWEALEAARNGLERIRLKIKNYGLRIVGIEKKVASQEFLAKFNDAIGDDFNTPQALAVLQELLKSDLGGDEKIATVYEFDKVLGLDLASSQDSKNKEVSPELKQQIEKLIKDRNQARAKKDWELADKIRDELDSLGVEVVDGEVDSSWRIK